MKNTLYIIAGLLIVIWAIVYFGFQSFGAIHMVLILAILLIVARIIFDKKLTNKK
jgi:tryptophan-rich sensory protein